MNYVHEMLTSILPPLLFAFIKAGHLLFPEEEPLSLNDSFVVTREVLEQVESPALRYFGQTLPSRRYQDDRRYLAYVESSERFPDVFSCLDIDPAQELADLTRLRRDIFEETQDLEVCIWCVGSLFDDAAQLAEWLRALGTENIVFTNRKFSSFDETDALVNQEALAIVAVWRTRGGRFGKAYPLSQLKGIVAFLFYNMSLSIVLSEDGEILEVEIGLSVF